MTKKRKTTDDNLSSRKKTKSEKVSKKEEQFTCDECKYKKTQKNALIKHKETSCEASLD